MGSWCELLSCFYSSVRYGRSTRTRQTMLPTKEIGLYVYVASRYNRVWLYGTYTRASYMYYIP